MGYLYRLDFSSGKSYVGLTTGTVADRFYEHQQVARTRKRNSILYNAWRKHGEPTVTTVCEVPDAELCAAEVALIAGLKTLYPAGYNTTVGGEASPMKSALVAAKVADAKRGKTRVITPEWRENIRRARTGKTLSPETRAKISAQRKGKPSPLKGRKLAPEHTAKVIAWHTGRKRTPEQRERIRAARARQVMKPRGPMSAEQKAKLSAALRGNTIKRDYCARLRLEESRLSASVPGAGRAAGEDTRESGAAR